MRRRDLISLIGIAAVTQVVALRAQQSGPMRRIGVLTEPGPKQSSGAHGIAAFKKALQQSGWSEGVNTRIDMRWCENSVERARRYAAELVSLTRDVILAATCRAERRGAAVHHQNAAHRVLNRRRILEEWAWFPPLLGLVVTLRAL